MYWQKLGSNEPSFYFFDHPHARNRVYRKNVGSLRGTINLPKTAVMGTKVMMHKLLLLARTKLEMIGFLID